MEVVHSESRNTIALMIILKHAARRPSQGILSCVGVFIVCACLWVCLCACVSARVCGCAHVSLGLDVGLGVWCVCTGVCWYVGRAGLGFGVHVDVDAVRYTGTGVRAGVSAHWYACFTLFCI